MRPGRDIVIIETVGVGQDEVDIVRTADVSIVVLVPGTGDEVQALKAGIMEIADIFVVNKADREGADRTASGVEAMLSLGRSPPDEWRPPILKTEATTGAGVPELVEAIDRFRRHAPERLGQRRRARSEFRLRELLAARFMARVDATLGPDGPGARSWTRSARARSIPTPPRATSSSASRLRLRALVRGRDRPAGRAH